MIKINFNLQNYHILTNIKHAKCKKSSKAKRLLNLDGRQVVVKFGLMWEDIFNGFQIQTLLVNYAFIVLNNKYIYGVELI